MEQGTATQKRAASAAEQINEWCAAIRNLGRDAGGVQELEPILKRVKTGDRELVNLAVIGGPNSGKTTVVNALIGYDILPVSSIPSQVSFDLSEAEDGQEQEFVVAGVSRPISQLQSVLRNAQGSPVQVQLRIHFPWANEASVHISERPALDADDAHVDEAAKEVLREVDLAVIVVDALSPVRRADAVLFANCADQAMPAVITVSRADKLANEERETVIAYIRKQVGQYLPAAEVVEGKTEPLRSAIQEAGKRTDFSIVRMEQTKRTLASALGMIVRVIAAGEQEEARKRAELDAQLEQHKNQVKANELIWLEIEQEIGVRIQKIEGNIRQHLAANTEAILDRLSNSLEKTGDVKKWWDVELKFLLEEQLRVEAGQNARTIDLQLAADRRWLQEELHRRFRLPLPIGPEPTLTNTRTEVATGELELSDASRLKVFTRVGSAAMVLAAGTLFATAGIGGAVLATSLLAGLGAEQLINLRSAQNREKVRAQMEAIVAQATLAYASDISAKLQAWYRQAIASLRATQAEFEEKQAHSFESARSKGPAVGTKNWAELRSRATALAAELSSRS